MNNLLVVIFDNKREAQEGDRVLRDLSEQRELTVYAAAFVMRGEAGNAVLKDLKHENSLTLTHNPLFGGAVGLLAGLLGAPFGAGLLTASAGALTVVAGGGFLHLMLDFVKAGGREDFANEVASFLQPHMIALLADVEESRTFLLDSRMKEAGGVVFRQPCARAATR